MRIGIKPSSTTSFSKKGDKRFATGNNNTAGSVKNFHGANLKLITYNL